MQRMTSLSLAAVLFGAASLAGAALESDRAEAFDGKCWGIAKAGENDCANAAGTHACAGQSTVNYYGGDWKAATSAEECTALGGKTEPFEGVNPAKAS